LNRELDDLLAYLVVKSSDAPPAVQAVAGQPPAAADAGGAAHEHDHHSHDASHHAAPSPGAGK